MLWESLTADKKIQLLGFVKERNAVGLGNNDQEVEIVVKTQIKYQKYASTERLSSMCNYEKHVS